MTLISSGGGTSGSFGAVGSNELQNAVFSYIQAVRALGRTRVNTIEIASALGVNAGRVAEAIAHLESKGVKRAG